MVGYAEADATVDMVATRTLTQQFQIRRSGGSEASTGHEIHITYLSAYLRYFGNGTHLGCPNASTLPSSLGLQLNELE